MIPVHRETLRHNPLNEVTGSVERLTDATGRTLVRKVLRRPDGAGDEPGGDEPGGGDGARPWAASTRPRHWNYWRREAEAYRSGSLAASLHGTGLDLAASRVTETADGAVLELEDVAGTSGTAFDLADHVALAGALGRWHARGPLDEPWTSTRFLRDYSGSKPVPWHLLEDDAAWRQPLVADLWPAGLRDGWRRLVAHRELLLRTSERLPRTTNHLDLWVSNEIRRPDGAVVLLDWAFVGDGAVGEDLGNHLPDAVFDLFWPAERLPELADACWSAFCDGLRDGGWTGRRSDARLGMITSAVKYDWLLPLLLQRAGDAEHQAYHRAADAEHLYRQRGLALQYLVDWCDEALTRPPPSPPP